MPSPEPLQESTPQPDNQSSGAIPLVAVFAGIVGIVFFPRRSNHL
jgi:hypothetical protein